jgi:ACR3 family arsenite efflux pump ArsB
LATISTICALLVVFISTSLKANNIISHPPMLLWGILLAVVYYLIMFLVSLFFTGLIVDSYDNQMPIVYGTTSKNLSIGVALALSAFSGPVVLGVVFCFMVQMPCLVYSINLLEKKNKNLPRRLKKKKKEKASCFCSIKKNKKGWKQFKESELKMINFKGRKILLFKVVKIN